MLIDSNDLIKVFKEEFKSYLNMTETQVIRLIKRVESDTNSKYEDDKK